MKKNDLTKMIRKELHEAISARFNTTDKILDALLAGIITKTQAKRFIAALHDEEDNSPAFDAFDDINCGSSSRRTTC